jgi:L-alanine-DL-glutamate epimerase-like enolase superfamily enzyme
MGRARPELIGLDPFDRSAIWSRFWQSRRWLGGATAVAAIDIALWDIAGKAVGQPVHRLLGTHRESILAYKSDPVLGGAAAHAEDLTAWRELGWKAYKAHAQRGPNRLALRAQLEVLKALGDHAGGEMQLMFDAHAYAYRDALTVGKTIEELGFVWFEDPLAAHDIHGHRELKRYLRIPVIATELVEGGADALQPWLTTHATDALRGDWATRGGITGLLRLAHLAEAFGLPLEVHEGYGGLGNLANLNVIMAIPNCTFFEAMLFQPTSVRTLDEMNWGLVHPLEVDDHGRVHAPTRPGLGSDVDWERVRSVPHEQMSG